MVIFGDNFLKAKVALCVWVPSVVVPQDRNILINPLHPKIIEVKILDEEPFLIDQRMFS
jgi:RES domain-containing protein